MKLPHTDNRILSFAILLIIAVSPAALGQGERPFSDLVGSVEVGPVKQLSPMQVPFIVWGGDMATFYANGGLETKPGTIFHENGLNLKLKPGDDFIQQVRDYMSGKSPFLRGTFRMMGLASEVISRDPRTKGVMVLQMTWSQGDHLVVREGLKTVSDLKGKKIVLQTGGPHVGMLDDVLKTANLGWDDVDVVWAKDLTATPDSPASLFRSRADIAGCFVVTPDMLGLTGGLHETGTGAEGTVRGARVLVSTAELSRSIADVYVCRKDFYDQHRDIVEKFVRGYLKACENVIDLMQKFETTGSTEYSNLLEMTREIYTTDVIPTEEDAHGLLLDCKFVGYPGNVAFFTQEGNLHGFQAFQKSALDLAAARGWVKVRNEFFPSGLDYQSKTFTDYLAKTELERGERFKAEAVREEVEFLSSGGALDERTIYSFTIGFAPNQTEFRAEQYGTEFQKVVELADKYGNAVIAIRGHSDPTKTLVELVRAGMQRGVLKRSGTAGNFQYSLNGKPLDLQATDEVIRLIEGGAFDGVADHNPRETIQAALNLSRKRAEVVRSSILEYAEEKGLHIDQEQVQPVGVGIREPFIAKPTSMAEAERNMRVEFSLLRVSAEVVKESDFDF